MIRAARNQIEARESSRTSLPAETDSTPAEQLLGGSLSSDKPMAVRPYWQTQPCPPWCGNQHSDGDAVDDRRCLSEWSAEVTLTTEEPTRLDNGVRCGGASYVPLTPVIYVERGFREVSPRVVVATQYREFEFGCTTAEAQALGEALLAGVTLAEGVA